MGSEQNNRQTDVKQSFFAKQKLIESARMVFQLFSAVLKNATLYPEDHPILQAAAEKLYSKTEELLKDRNEVSFYIIGGELFFETLSVPIDQNLSLIMEQFTKKEVGGIIFKQEITAVEFIRFAALICKEKDLFTEKRTAHEIMASEGVTHITLHHAMLVDKQLGVTIKAEQKKASDIFQDTIDALKEVIQAVNMDKASSMRKVNVVIQTMVDYVLDNKDALIGLTNIKMYDEYTFAHSVNTAILAVSLGTYLSFDKPQLAILGVAALLHDIGKVHISGEIINKPGKLTEEEWKIVQRHPIEGALILSAVRDISKLAMVASFEHHQHGKNAYPRMEDKYQRHPFSQIISLADSYEAITSPRVYYSAQISPDKAIRILLKNKGVTSSPVLLQAFINMIGIFPVGTLLKLDTGEIGLAMHQTQDLLRPRVLLLDKFDGSEKETGEMVSLIETAEGNYKRSVSGTIDPNIARIDLKRYFD
jgi:HD-GYP domain-containing protein (c-di-GMP phosphodiesterase class II)